jgi:hypothetical protein
MQMKQVLKKQRLSLKQQLKQSLPTVLRVLKKHGYFIKRKTKTERKRDLREIKNKYKAFEKIQIDVKYLDDILSSLNITKIINCHRTISVYGIKIKLPVNPYEKVELRITPNEETGLSTVRF